MTIERYQVFDVEEGEEPPPLVRLVVGDDPAEDFSYARPAGFTASPRAVAVLQAYCTNLQVEPVAG
jgi:hypothetical protein